MIRSRLLLPLLASSLLVSACKKEEAEPQSIPVPAQSVTPVAADPVPAATPAPIASAAPTATAAPAASVADPGATDAAGTGAAAKSGGASIEVCCKALQAVATKSGKSPEAKAKAGTAAKICFGIDKLVKSGKTARSSAMTQIKSALGGTTAPEECN